jgi:HEAT repeat protein
MAEWIKQLSDQDDWEARQKAADNLGKLGPEAKAALPDLRERLAIDEDDDVRSSALRAIANIEQDKSALIPLLQTYLKDIYTQVRAVAAEYLLMLGPAAKNALGALWDRLSQEDDEEVSDKLAEAILAIDSDRSALFSKCIGSLRSGDLKGASAAAVILAALAPTGEEQEKASSALWSAIRQSNERELIDFAFSSLIKITPDKNGLVARLINDQTLEDWKKSYLILSDAIRDRVDALWKNDGDSILPLIGGALENEDARATALEWLEEKKDEMPDAARAGMLERVFHIFRASGDSDIFHLIKSLGGEKAVEQILADPNVAATIKGRNLLTTAKDYLDEKWAKDKDGVLPLVLAALEDSWWGGQRLAANWLRKNAADIPRNWHGKVVEALEKLKSGHPQVRASTEAALIQLKQQEQRVEASPFMDVIKDPEAGEDAKIKAIGKLMESATREALRSLIGEWVKWIVYDDKALMDAAAEAMRAKALAVQPLVEHFNQDLQADVRLWDHIFEEVIPTEYQERLRSVYGWAPHPSGKVPRQSLEEWITYARDDSDEVAERIKIATNKGWAVERQAIEIAEMRIAKGVKGRQSRVHNRIARQLAEMSNPNLVEDKLHDDIIKELKKHAVPSLGKRLPKEENVDIRESLAQTLGYVGGREAVDALARAVAGEERVRAFRQDLLSKYYLEPSKARSEEAAKILSEAVSEAKRTLHLVQWLNIVTFVVGLALLVGGILTIIYREDAATRFVGALSTLGGIAGLISRMVIYPVDKVQHAMANLVQIETAFTSFIWELNLNGTYIQSQYVAEGVLTDNEIGQTVSRIEDAMNLAMNLVATYTQDRGQRIVTRINSLSPAAGDTGGEVTVHGQYLFGDNGDKKGRGGIVAVNHTPIKTPDISWKERKVKFKLPAALPGLDGQSGTVWLSLFVDGMETNALPFYAVRKHEIVPPQAPNGSPRPGADAATKLVGTAGGLDLS